MYWSFIKINFYKLEVLNNEIKRDNMEIDIAIIINIFVFVGVSILGISFFPIRKLIAQLDSGGMRRKWNLLSGIIFLFLLGYIGYNIIYWDKFFDYLNLVISIVFFVSSVVVLLVGLLTLQTATELNQIYTLRHDNVIDPLMGIYNRRYFDVQLSKEIKRAFRYNLPLSMLLLDIDHFKNINDTFGHYIGDLVLKNLGSLLRKNLRETDIIARYGGEEIAVIAPHTPISSAEILAQRLRLEIEKSTILPVNKSENRQEINLTISIGVSDLGKKNIDAQMLIKKTDQALYQAKQEGRNRVVIFKDKKDL